MAASRASGGAGRHRRPGRDGHLHSRRRAGGAALALGEDGRAVYAAGPRGLMTAFADDAEFLGAVAEAEDEVAGLLAAARELRAGATAAVTAARAAHAAARAMPSGTAEQAEARAAALADAA